MSGCFLDAFVLLLPVGVRSFCVCWNSSFDSLDVFDKEVNILCTFLFSV